MSTLRKVAAHEAGHKTMAEFLGYPATVSLYLDEDDTCDMGGQCDVPSLEYDPNRNPAHAALVGVAGAVAEYLLWLQVDRPDLAEGFFGPGEPVHCLDFTSQSDRDMIGYPGWAGTNGEHIRALEQHALDALAILTGPAADRLAADFASICLEYRQVEEERLYWVGVREEVKARQAARETTCAPSVDVL